MERWTNGQSLLWEKAHRRQDGWRCQFPGLPEGSKGSLMEGFSHWTKESAVQILPPSALGYLILGTSPTFLVLGAPFAIWRQECWFHRHLWALNKIIKQNLCPFPLQFVWNSKPAQLYLSSEIISIKEMLEMVFSVHHNHCSNSSLTALKFIPF